MHTFAGHNCNGQDVSLLDSTFVEQIDSVSLVHFYGHGFTDYYSLSQLLLEFYMCEHYNYLPYFEKQRIVVKSIADTLKIDRIVNFINQSYPYEVAPRYGDEDGAFVLVIFHSTKFLFDLPIAIGNGYMYFDTKVYKNPLTENSSFGFEIISDW
ncbi:MAG: hypothetical protein SFY70_04905 [Bacteroidia bacterium]|nr:hypothetical protein [Bacteroidia bacterium]